MASIFDQFVVQKPNLLMEQLAVTPDFYEQLEKKYAGFADHTLVSAHQFTDKWPTWEIHPKGDEMVVLLSGSATFQLKSESGVESVLLDRPGMFVLVPKNTWHTALIEEAASMLFITPGEGTLNAASPP